MKELKKVFENEHVRKIENTRRLIDDYFYKSIYYLNQSFEYVDKILSKFKSKKPLLRIVKSEIKRASFKEIAMLSWIKQKYKGRGQDIWAHIIAFSIFISACIGVCLAIIYINK